MQQNSLPELVWISSCRRSCSWFPKACSEPCVVTLLVSWSHTSNILFGCALLRSGVPDRGLKLGPWLGSAVLNTNTWEVPTLKFKKITRDDELFSSFWFYIFLSVVLYVWFTLLCILFFNHTVHFFFFRIQSFLLCILTPVQLYAFWFFFIFQYIL